MNYREVILHLSLIDGVGPAAIQKLITLWPDQSDWQALYSLSLFDWRQRGITEKMAERLVVGLADRKELDAELALIEKHAINWITILDDEYPEQLKHIHIPPAVLYWRGIFEMSNCLAVVGSRDTNSYGEKMIARIVPQLVNHGFTIVSGGALGADAMAHYAALNAGGKTVIVLGSGLLQPSPRTNQPLFEKAIREDGAVISSFPLQAVAQPGNFPARNRIISGLSKGVLVVQAAQKSGARITAQYALEQGRDVFAIPGSIDDPLSAGCHALIKEGAKITVAAQDILQEYGVKEEAVQHTIKTELKPAISVQRQRDPLQQKIIERCMHPQSVDDLAVVCALALSEMQKALFELQLAGVVEQDFTGLWKTI